MSDLIERLKDLHKQATVERSHYYVGKCVRDSITELTSLTARVAELEAENRLFNEVVTEAKEKLLAETARAQTAEQNQRAAERERDGAVSNFRDAWQALLRLREEVESRSGGMVAPEHTGPEFAHEAEQIARGVILIYDRALAAGQLRRENERLGQLIAKLLPSTTVEGGGNG
jgi:hypothetical protein